MSHFRLHTKIKGIKYRQYLILGLFCLLAAGTAGYGIHSVGQARARSRETVLIHTEEELACYLLDGDSEEYNLNGNYRLEEDLYLGDLQQSIGTNLEPFTGSLDGNGHVIQGLERPLFGVMKRAKVEDLFLSNTKIVSPFTYNNGEHYTDGYGALTAYAVDSEIRNCGMNGEIHTGIPVESEYHLAKASPAEAEGRGPGGLEPGGTKETLEESSLEAEGNGVVEDGASGGQDVGDMSNPAEAGPGVEPDGNITEAEETTEAGPGIEPTVSSESKETASTSASGNKETADASASGSEETADASASGNEETADTSASGSEETVDTSASGSEETVDTSASGSGETVDASASGGGETVDTSASGSENAEHPSMEQTAGTGQEEPVEKTKLENSWNKNEVNPESELQNSSDSYGKIEKGTSEANIEKNNISAMEETIGFRSNNRQQLMMKIPELIEIDEENISAASPSDATPAEAESPDTRLPDTESSDTWEEPEYIGSPDGDIYILVTADRITVGGLVAEAAGETLIADSFTLVTVDSDVTEAETYAGGMTGIVGQECRLENSYAAGLADARGVTGGFAARNEGKIRNCYSSMTIGKRGDVRGAFTAEEEGILSGCVYDRQIACMEPESESAMGEMDTAGMDQIATPAQVSEEEFGLKGLNTSEMTGMEANVPGIWHTVEDAYPQIEYFSAHEHETLSASSQASAIALVLPDGLTLDDVLVEGGITLPSELDGKEISWQAEGGVWIDGQNKIMMEESQETSSVQAEVSVSRHEVPEVGSAMGTPADAVENMENTAGGEDAAGKKTGEIQLNGSIGGVTRSFTLSSVQAAAGEIYADWAAFGAAMAEWETAGKLSLSGAGTADDPYLIGTPEELALFVHKVNVDGQKALCATMTDNIDVSGSHYSADGKLNWSPILEFAGVFDGANHYVENIWMQNNRIMGKGFFGEIFNSGVVKNFGVKSGLYNCGNKRRSGGITGILQEGSVINCWNAAELVNTENETGGIAGFVADNTLIENCYNLGKITSSSTGTGGIVGVAWRGDHRILNCYNLGNFGGTTSGGGILGAINESVTIKIENCYNAGQVNTGKGIVRSTLNSDTVKAVVNNCYVDQAYSTDSQATALTTEQMKSWAFTYLLNGSNVEGVWQYEQGEYPTPGIAVPPVWTDVGQGILDGLIDGDGLTVGDGTADSFYEISNAEQLAVFAAKVNTTEPDACGKLKANIDLTGAKYHGTESDPILWEPMGTGLAGTSGDNIYTGTFAGQGHIIYGMKVKTDGYAGLFGCVGGSTTITKLGLDKTCSVEAISPGTSGLDGTAGFVGAVKDTGVVGDVVLEDCYNRAEIRGKSAKTAAFIGSDESTPDLTVLMMDCYTTGPMSSSGGTPSVLIGSSNGNDQTGCGNCYWDEAVEIGYTGGLTAAGAGFNGKLIDCLKLQTAEMKSQSLADRLNTGGIDWEWVRDKNNAYPTFKDMGIYTSWLDVGATASEPETASATEKGSLANPYLIWSPEDLAWFAYQVGQNSRRDLCAKLMTDISLFGGMYTGGNGYDSNDTEILARGLSWYPIGSLNSGNVYTGTFDGGGHVITKIHLTGDTYQGLFGVLGTGAVMKNTKVKTILGSASNASFLGGIAGYANGTGIKITECGNEGSFTANGTSVGGCLGYASSSSEVLVEGCYNGENGILDIKGNLVGGIIGEGSAGTVTVRNCYNRGRVAANGVDVGGIAGIAAKTISGCYNAGQVSGAGSSRMGGIKGGSNGMAEITGCVTVSSAPDSSAVSVTLDQLKTWGAAFRLNGEKVGQTTGMSWEFEAGTNGGFPYLIRETPKGAGEWDTVMEGVANGLVTITRPTGTPYEISSAEQLAWFAYEVNHGKPDLSAMLTGNIDMKNGEERYVPGGRLPWNPAGDAASPYAGTFSSKNLLDASDSSTIYQIQNLYVHTAGTAGVFGAVSGGSISRIGLVNADITSTGETGNAAGGIAGEMKIGAISRCYNRKEGAGASKVSALAGTTSGGFSGGIVGRINGGGMIVDCYNLDTEITAEGASARVGGITGGLAAEGSVQNSYNAVQKGGKLEALSSAQVGSIAGQAMAPEMIFRCWRDAAFAADQTGISDFGAVSGKNRQDQTDALNTIQGSGERLGVRRAWYTSLSSEPTRGLPTMEAPETISVTLEAADSGSGRTAALPAAVPAAVYRGIREETAGEIPVLPLTAKTEISSQFHTMGTQNANKKIGLAFGSGTDLAALSGSLTDPAASTGAINSLVLYTGGAYTYQKDRVLLIDVAASGVRYEIRAAIPGVVSKLLNVSLPVKVGIEDLNPAGSKHTSYSADLTLNNNNDYPIKGKALDLTPIEGEGYVVLKPVAKTDPYGSTKQLTDPSGGVKLGIADTKTAKGMIPGDGIYYTPAKGAAAEKWMEYQIKGKGVLPYRYFIEYEANPYYSDTNQYGYTVSYSFGISKEDMESSAEAVVK